MPADHFVGNLQVALVLAVPAFDSWFVTDHPDPFIATGRLVARATGPLAFKAERIDVIAPTEKGPEELNFCL